MCCTMAPHRLEYRGMNAVPSTNRTLLADAPFVEYCFKMAATKDDNDHIISVAACSSSVLLTDDVLVDIFSFLGPLDTAKCAQICKAWHHVATHSRSLWRTFVYNTFGFLAGGDDSGAACADWKAVYGHLTHKSKETPELLAARVVFSDDGSPIPGYLADNALRNNNGAWCTNVGVNQNVDLVIELQVPALVSGFVIENGGIFYDAPLKEALAFCSLKPIDLDGARKYNGAMGKEVVNMMEELLDGFKRKSLAARIVANHARFSAPCPDQPKAAFRVDAALPTAYSARLERRCDPVVANFVHFKLLSSFDYAYAPADNIDVKNLHTYGVPLATHDLAMLLQENNKDNNNNGVLKNPQPPDPSYKRMHALRDHSAFFNQH